MKKAKRGKASKAKAKRTGPSQRTAAERRAIDKRAAIASRDAKREQRAERAKNEAALKKSCPTCRAHPGAPCFDKKGRTVPPHSWRVSNGKRAKPRSIAAALSPLVTETSGNKGKGKTPAPSEREKIDAQRIKTFGVSHYSPDADLIDPKLIVVGERHRKDFGDLKSLARSIDDRGGLIQPIALKPPHSKPVLIAGERRLRAWALSRFAGQPIPCHFLDVDAIIAGEWDENAQRKDFTPSEAVKIQRTLEDVLRSMQASRPAHERAAPGRKASGEAAGRVKDKVGKLTGIKRESLRKAEAVVEAAERDQEKFGDLVDEMDRSGKVNAAHKKLKVREAKAAIVASPPVLPMNAKECGTWSIDFPHAGEPDQEQEKLDAAGRSFRPYPEMSIKTCCQFAREQIVPNAPETWSVWLWVTNFILVRGYHLHLIAALGFKPENACTMLTWDKVEIGRGQVLRDQTEHAILLTRGKPVVDVFGENPPTTLIREPRRENSRKPDAFYRLVERVTPSKRYAAIFSQGGEGENWDGHGDQVGKFAPAIARAAEGALINEAKAGESLVDRVFAALDQDTRDARLLDILDAIETAPDYKLPDAVDQWFSGEIGALVSGKRKLKLTAAGRERRDALLIGFRLKWLEAVEAGGGPQLPEHAREYLSGLKLTTGIQAKKLTALGRDRLAELSEERDDRAAMALLPDGLDALVALYRETLRAHHAAVIANDQETAEREEHRLELLEIKANGGTRFGMATNDSPAERLRSENRAAIGEVPMWGQEGIFRIDVDGMVAIVHYRPSLGFMGFHAEDGSKSFISDTGYRSGGGEGPALGCTVKQQAEAELREDIEMPLSTGGARREKRGKKTPLPMPEKWFRMPATWEEVDRDHMPYAGGKDLFGKPVKAKQIDLEEAIAAKAQPLDTGAIEEFENADLYRVPQDVIDAIGKLGGHTISRTIDWDQGEKGHSVATCQCGVMFRADRALPYSGENVIARLEEAHWREVLVLDRRVKAPIAAEGGVQEDIPEFLRRPAAPKPEAAA